MCYTGSREVQGSRVLSGEIGFSRWRQDIKVYFTLLVLETQLFVGFLGNSFYQLSTTTVIGVMCFLCS